MKKSNGLKVDIVLIKEGQVRKFLGITRLPEDVYSYFYLKGSEQECSTTSFNDDHLSRHGSGKVYRTIQGEAPFYPIKNGELGAPVPMPFWIKITEPEKPHLENIRSVEKLPLFHIFGEIFNPEIVFQSLGDEKSKADYQFHVDIDNFIGQSLRLEVLLVEPGQEAQLKVYLDQLRQSLHGADKRVSVCEVNLYTGASPWLAIALLAEH